MVYDDIYVMRGDVENCIKELKQELKADRLSCHRFLANQFRLVLHTAAYCLFWLLRRHLRGTELATAQVGQHLTAQALEDRGPPTGDQPPHLDAPGLGIPFPRPVGLGAAKLAGQPHLISLPSSLLLPLSSAASNNFLNAS